MKTNLIKCRIPRRQAGFSMFEVLIAIVVTSVGLLGLASMQATGLQNNQRAYQRSQATILAYDMADRIRANMSSRGTYVTLSADDGSDEVIVEGEAEIELPTCTINSVCTSDEIAQHDFIEWNTTLADILPGGAGTVTSVVNAAGFTIFTISVNWDDNRDGTVDNADPAFQVSFQP